MVTFLLPFVNTMDQMEGPLRNIEEHLRKLQKTVNWNSLEKSRGYLTLFQVKPPFGITQKCTNLGQRQQAPLICNFIPLEIGNRTLESLDPLTSTLALHIPEESLFPYTFSLSFFFSKWIEFVQSHFTCIILPEQMLQNPPKKHYFLTVTFYCKILSFTPKELLSQKSGVLWCTALSWM